MRLLVISGNPAPAMVLEAAGHSVDEVRPAMAAIDLPAERPDVAVIDARDVEATAELVRLLQRRGPVPVLVIGDPEATHGHPDLAWVEVLPLPLTRDLLIAGLEAAHQRPVPASPPDLTGEPGPRWAEPGSTQRPEPARETPSDPGHEAAPGSATAQPPELPPRHGRRGRRTPAPEAELPPPSTSRPKRAAATPGPGPRPAPEPTRPPLPAERTQPAPQPAPTPEPAPESPAKSQRAPQPEPKPPAALRPVPGPEPRQAPDREAPPTPEPPRPPTDGPTAIDSVPPQRLPAAAGADWAVPRLAASAGLPRVAAAADALADVRGDQLPTAGLEPHEELGFLARRQRLRALVQQEPAWDDTEPPPGTSPPIGSPPAEPQPAELPPADPPAPGPPTTPTPPEADDQRAASDAAVPASPVAATSSAATSGAARAASSGAVAAPAKPLIDPIAHAIRVLRRSLRELTPLREVAAIVAEDAIERVDADAAAVMVRDGDMWRVAGGHQLRRLEERLVLDDRHWLVKEILPKRRGVLVEESDVARNQLHGAPLAHRRHVLVVSLPAVQSLIIVARESGEAFDPGHLVTLMGLRDEATPLLQAALDARELARDLAHLRDVPDPPPEERPSYH